MDTFKTLRSLIKFCQRHPPCASQVLHTHGPPCLRAAFKCLNSPEECGKRNRVFSVEQAINIALSKGVIWSSVVPPERVKESPWFEVISP